MLNVGNGNSFIYVNKFKNLVLIFDCGNGISFGKENAADWLKFYGINHVDKIFISHNHQDHFNGLESIKKYVKVYDIITRDNLTTEWLIKGVKISSWLLDGNLSDENDKSRVLLLESKNVNVLFMGDITKKGEKILLENNYFTTKIFSIKVDLLQLGHHGSKTSSSEEFLSFVNPEKVFISCEKRGKLQFPNEQTIQTLNKLNIKFWTTDSKFNWTFVFNKQKILNW